MKDGELKLIIGCIVPEKKSYYFPVLFLMPAFEGPELDLGGFALSIRRWQTTVFDLATLATQHKLHLPYQAMDLLLAHCNLEVRVSDAG